MIHRLHLSAVLALALIAPANAQSKIDSADTQLKRIRELIDQLAKTGEPDYGYSPTANGISFLPVDTEGRFTSDVLFQPAPVPSGPMRELVKFGATAVPQLLEHLTDGRRTKIVITNQFGGFFSVSEDPKPEDDNKKRNDKEILGNWPLGHTIRVGDLCYVALGQILNRQYSAVSYIPSGNIRVTSTVRAPSIAKELRTEWANWSPNKHREQLVAELKRRANVYWQIAAAKRLAYYYPEAFVAPVLWLLKQEVYDPHLVDKFVSDTLYNAKTPKLEREHFNAFLKAQGEAYRHGIAVRLYVDLEEIENNEKNADPAPAEVKDQPRQLLIRLYSKDKSVKGTDVPTNPGVWTTTDLHTFISEGLTYDDFAEIDRAVRDLLQSTKHDWIATACIGRLTGRGFDDEIEQALRARGMREDLKETAEFFRERQGWSPLHIAVEQKHLERVSRWIAAGKDVNIASRTGETPLHIAAKHGAVDVAAALLAARPKIDARDSAGRTPLQVSVEEDQFELARLLVKKGATPTNLLAAAFAGRADLAKEFLSRGKAETEKRTKQKRSPLHLAAWEGKEDVVAMLLRAGAAPNSSDEEEWTPLHLAASGGHDRIVASLLDQKADLRAKTKYTEQTALNVAIANRRLSASKLLVERKADAKEKWSSEELSLLHIAAHAGHDEGIHWLLSLGLPIDGTDKKGNTPLHYAAKQGHAKSVQTLLERQASVEVKDVWGNRPLVVAIEGGHIEVVRLLLQHKADAAWGRSQSLSPARFAERHDQPKIADLLRKNAKAK